MKPLPTPKEIVQEAIEKGWVKPNQNNAGVSHAWKTRSISKPPSILTRKRKKAFNAIKAVVAQYFDIHPDWMNFQMRGPRRVATARMTAMLLCVQDVPMATTLEVGAAFSRDHTSVTHARKHAAELEPYLAECRKILTPSQNLEKRC